MILLSCSRGCRKDCIIRRSETHRSSEITAPFNPKYIHRLKRKHHTVRAKFARWQFLRYILQIGGMPATVWLQELRGYVQTRLTPSLQIRLFLLCTFHFLYTHQKAFPPHTEWPKSSQCAQLQECDLVNKEPEFYVERYPSGQKFGESINTPYQHSLKQKAPAFLQGAVTAWCRLGWPYSFTYRKLYAYILSRSANK